MPSGFVPIVVFQPRLIEHNPDEAGGVEAAQRAPFSEAGVIPPAAMSGTARPSEMNSFAGLNFPVRKSAGPTLAYVLGKSMMMNAAGLLATIFAASAS